MGKKTSQTTTVTRMMEKMNWREGLRASLCMLPMLIAYGYGRGDVGVPLGQAGFLISALPLPRLKFYRLSNGVIFLAFGLGLYLIGSIVTRDYWAGLIFTFIVSMALSLLTGWKTASLLALTFFSVYAAGLNNSGADAEKITQSFYAFSIAILWCTAVSMLSWWRGHDFSDYKKVGIIPRIKMGIRMGVGTSISFAIAQAFFYSKIGWAPSATANVVRFDSETSKKRAKLRVLGSVVGAILAGTVFLIFGDPVVWVVVAFILAIINGFLVDINKWGYFPFYTTIILILYSVGDPTSSVSTTTQRVAYNVVGVLVSYVVVTWSFPRVFSMIDEQKIARMAKQIDRA